jgi:hypothetical protein
MQTITPYLWFDGKAEEAMNFYLSVFPNSRTVNIARGPDGGVMTATFELDGQRFMALNGGPQFQFTEAISLFVNCETQEEVDAYWEKLCEGGKPGRCGWLKDKFGVSWQVVPSALGRLIGGADRERAGRALAAMMGMSKIEIAGLQAAYDGREPV